MAEERLKKQIREFIERLESQPPESTQERFPGPTWSDAMIHRRNREPYLRDLGRLRMRQTPVLEEEATGKDFFKRYIESKRELAQEVMPFIPPLRTMRWLSRLTNKAMKPLPDDVWKKIKKRVDQRRNEGGGGPDYQNLWGTK